MQAYYNTTLVRLSIECTAVGLNKKNYIQTSKQAQAQLIENEGFKSTQWIQVIRWMKKELNHMHWSKYKLDQYRREFIVVAYFFIYFSLMKKRCFLFSFFLLENHRHQTQFFMLFVFFTEKTWMTKTIFDAPSWNILKFRFFGI